MSEEPRWASGSRFRVRSADVGEEPVETSGVFEGFLPLSTGHVMVLTLDESHEDEGTRRFIPVDKILAVDVLEMAEEESEDEDQLYYS